MGGEIHLFKNKKDFVKLFPEGQQREIKRLLNRYQFRVQKASPDELVHTMNEVANLFKNGTPP